MRRGASLLLAPRRMRGAGRFDQRPFSVTVVFGCRAAVRAVT
jgi:hypothetical protein